MVRYEQKSMLPGEFDHYVKASRGWGVSYQVSNGFAPASKLDVIKSQPRHLKWFERLKASAGELQFGKQLEFEGRLLAGSSVRLVKDETKARIIMLEQGVFRAKSLDETKLSNVIIVGDWLQVDLGKGADVILSFKQGSDSVNIQVLQGHVQSRRRSPIERPDPYGELSELERKDEIKTLAASQKSSFVYQAGYSYTVFQRSPKDPDPQLLSGRLVVGVFPESLSKITRKIKGIKKRRRSRSKQNSTSLSVTKEFAKIKQMINMHNYADALESLANLDTKSTKDDAVWVTLLGATTSIILPKTTLNDDVLGLASRFYPNDQALLFKLAQHKLNLGKIDVSDKLFLRAEGVGLPRTDISGYYLGLSHFRNKAFKKSAKYLRAVEKSAENEKLYNSAHRWRLLAEQSIDWYASASLAAVYDSNVLRVKDVSFYSGDLGGFEEISSFLASGEASLYKAFFKGSVLSPFISFDANKLIYSPDFSFADYVYERLTLGLDTSLWGVVWGNQFYVETHIFSEDRTFDGAGIRSEFLMAEDPSKLRLSFDVVTYRDPVSNSYNIKDPVSQNFLNSIADLSSSYKKASLGAYLYTSRHGSSYALLSYTRRDFSNTFTNVISYKVPSLTLSNDLGGIFQETWKLDLTYEQFEYFNRGSDKIDNRYTLDLAMRLELHGNFTIIFDNGFEHQASSLDSRNYDKFISRLGLLLTL